MCDFAPGWAIKMKNFSMILWKPPLRFIHASSLVIKAKALLLDDDSVPFLIGFEDILTDIKLVCEYATKTSYFYISWFIPPTLRFHTSNTRPFDSRPSRLGPVLILNLSSRIWTKLTKSPLCVLSVIVYPVKFMVMRSVADLTGAVPPFYFFQLTIVNHKSSIPMRPPLHARSTSQRYRCGARLLARFS